MLQYVEFVFTDATNEVQAELRAMAFIYLQLLRGIKELPHTQIKVYVRHSEEEGDITSTPLQLSKSIIVLYANCNTNKYVVLSKEEKVSVQLDIMHKAMCYLFALHNISNREIVELKAQLQEYGLVRDITLLSKVYKDKSLTLVTQVDFDSFTYILKYSVAGIDRDIQLFKGHTAYLFYYKTLFNNLVIKHNKVIVRSRKAAIQFVHEIGSETFNVVSADNMRPILDYYSYDSEDGINRYMAYDI
ncbi:MAG: hypothetical protein JST49_08530 [Bacteroidetes bacterium]|nr:hypothetical protein [Bacteroidota bacterium]